MLNRSASLAMSTSVLKALPGKLDIKRHSPSILYFLLFVILGESSTSAASNRNLISQKCQARCTSKKNFSECFIPNPVSLSYNHENVLFCVKTVAQYMYVTRCDTYFPEYDNLRKEYQDISSRSLYVRIMKRKCSM